jgi:hypothetical protein
MRALRNALLLVVTLLVAGLPVYAQSSDEVRLSIAKDVMEEIAHDQLPLVIARFSPDLKESISQDDMEVVLAQLMAVTGAFQKQLSQDARTVKGMPVFVSRSQYEHYKVELGLAFDDANRIVSIWIVPISDLTAGNMESSAKAVTELLRQGQFDEASAKFDDRMKMMMSSQKLGASWSHVMMHLGPFKNVKSALKDPEFDTVDVRCEFEHGDIIVRIAFGPSGNITGLWMLPAPEDDGPKDKAHLLNDGWNPLRPEVIYFC